MKPKLEHALYGSLAGIAVFVAVDQVVKHRKGGALQRNMPQALPAAPRPVRRLPVPRPVAQDLHDASPTAASDVTLDLPPDDPRSQAEVDLPPDDAFEPELDLIEDEVDRLGALLDRFCLLSPIGGHFYPVGAGDTPETIARAVLSQIVERPTREQILDYIHLFSSCAYNLERYGTRSTSMSFPSKWCVPGLAMGLRAAFRPVNADAFDLMASGLTVPRTCDSQARPTDPDASSYGMPWLVPVCPERLSTQGIVTCEGYAWSCGTSQIEPPPQLMALLRGAA